MRLRRQQLIIPEEISIKRLVAVLPIETAMEIIRAAARREFYLHGALRVALRPRSGSRDADFRDCVCLRLDQGEETVRSLQDIVLDVQTIEGDIQHALWQSINGRLSWTTCRG